MTSSTSSSSAALLGKSFGVFALLFAGYNCALVALRPQAVHFQNQWEKNVSLAEEFIAESAKPEIVVVGSSLAARLEPGGLGARIRNLSFAGGTAATGMEIIRRCRTLPKVVLVESNVLRNLDTAFVESRFYPLSAWAKRWLPSSRVRNQPVNLLLGALKGRPKPETHIPDPRVFATLLADQQRDHAKPHDAAWLDGAIAETVKVVEALEARGVRTAFFRMPVDSSLEGSPKEKDIQERFRKAFPAPRYLWLEVDPGDYLTGDGLHLEPQSARDFSARLRASVESQGL